MVKGQGTEPSTGKAEMEEKFEVEIWRPRPRPIAVSDDPDGHPSDEMLEDYARQMREERYGK